jgi:nicotinamide-nucleotide amidase
VGLVYFGIKKGKTLLIKENKFKAKKRDLIQKSTVNKVIKIVLSLI